ncbi:hypothetical protein [Bosea sp. RAC05]|uniref:hypothetical protein n=1 Tax=Bosea sp. RAC05 TaxID=1842539 RepID=UPI00083E583B|nr:hypothetical protein [Bosea sp. RAC05]AOG02845.1 hypothetical protein BSY19_5228 [Bosea sp. RAC05]
MTEVEPAPEVHPVKAGDWVVSRFSDDKVAKVRSVYLEGETVLVDLVLFARDGRTIGRESPVMGGPRNFEPACEYKDWQRIREPSFPLKLMWVEQGDGRKRATWEPALLGIPDRKEPVQTRRRRRAPAPEIKSLNMDATTEAAKLRFAAQELRDAARQHGVPKMIERAEAMEAEAEALDPRAVTSPRFR